jgi:hypothetical protein
MPPASQTDRELPQARHVTRQDSDSSRMDRAQRAGKMAVKNLCTVVMAGTPLRSR